MSERSELSTSGEAPTVRPLTIAIDGPAGSGKSSTARAVAEEMGLMHLDSGAFYRALTRVALDREVDPEEWSSLDVTTIDSWRVAAEVRNGGLRITASDEDITGRLRGSEVNAHVSRMAAVPAVRDWLLKPLRSVARAGVVADGRDIGTVVYPDADLKVFLVCDPEERAVRRLREQEVTDPSPEEVQAEVERLLERDSLDTEREIAPLLRAPDAVVLDTTALDFAAQVRFIVRMARERGRG